MDDTNQGGLWGRRREDICDYGVSRMSLSITYQAAALEIISANHKGKKPVKLSSVALFAPRLLCATPGGPVWCVTVLVGACISKSIACLVYRELVGLLDFPRL